MYLSVVVNSQEFTTCSKPLVAKLPVNDAQNLYKQGSALATAV